MNSLLPIGGQVKQAREAGVTDSVLTRLMQRGRLERTARGVYRIRYVPPDRFSQYRETVLWAKANRGPNEAALSHTTALAVYGISDANPSLIHLTVPRSARLRRQMPKGVVLHREDLAPDDVAVEEGIPLTTIGRTVADLLRSGGRIDLIRQAISDARREGLIHVALSRGTACRVPQHSSEWRNSNAPPHIDIAGIRAWLELSLERTRHKRQLTLTGHVPASHPARRDSARSGGGGAVEARDLTC